MDENTTINGLEIVLKEVEGQRLNITMGIGKLQAQFEELGSLLMFIENRINYEKNNKKE